MFEIEELEMTGEGVRKQRSDMTGGSKQRLEMMGMPRFDSSSDEDVHREKEGGKGIPDEVMSVPHLRQRRAHRNIGWEEGIDEEEEELGKLFTDEPSADASAKEHVIDMRSFTKTEEIPPSQPPKVTNDTPSMMKEVRKFTGHLTGQLNKLFKRAGTSSAGGERRPTEAEKTEKEGAAGAKKTAKEKKKEEAKKAAKEKKKEEKKSIDTRVLSLAIFIFTFTTASHLLLPGTVDLSTKKIANNPQLKATINSLLEDWGSINLIALFHGVAAIFCQLTDIAPFNIPVFKKWVLLTGNFILYIGGCLMGIGFATYLRALALVGESKAQKRLTYFGIICISCVLALSLLVKLWGLFSFLWDCCCGKPEDEEEGKAAAVGGDVEAGEGGDGGGDGGDGE